MAGRSSSQIKCARSLPMKAPLYHQYLIVSPHDCHEHHNYLLSFRVHPSRANIMYSDHFGIFLTYFSPYLKGKVQPSVEQETYLRAKTIAASLLLSSTLSCYSMNVLSMMLNETIQVERLVLAVHRLPHWVSLMPETLNRALKQLQFTYQGKLEIPTDFRLWYPTPHYATSTPCMRWTSFHHTTTRGFLLLLYLACNHTYNHLLLYLIKLRIIKILVRFIIRSFIRCIPWPLTKVYIEPSARFLRISVYLSMHCIAQ